MIQKIFIVSIVIVLNTGNSNAQVLISLLLGDKLNSEKLEFGLDGGVNYSTISGLDGKQKANFNLGFYFDFRLKNPSWKVHTGVIVKSSAGINDLAVYPLNDPDLDNAFEGGKVNRKIHYFNVPVMMKYVIQKAFYLEAGFQAGLRTKAEDVFIKTVTSKDDLKYTKDISDSFHRIDWGLAGGMGYRLMKGKGMNLGLYYYYGLVNISNNNHEQAQYNRSLYLTIGIPIGAGNKEKD